MNSLIRAISFCIVLLANIYAFANVPSCNMWDSLYIHKDYYGIAENANIQTNSYLPRSTIILQSAYYRLCNANFEINTLDSLLNMVDVYDDKVINQCFYDLLLAYSKVESHRDVVRLWHDLYHRLSLDCKEVKYFGLLLSESYLAIGDIEKYIITMQNVVTASACLDTTPETHQIFGPGYYTKEMYNTMQKYGLNKQAYAWKDTCISKGYFSQPHNYNLTLPTSFVSSGIDSLIYLIESNAIPQKDRHSLLDSLATIDDIPCHNLPVVSELYFRNHYYANAIQTYEKELKHVSEFGISIDYDEPYVICQNIAVSYLWMNNPDSALVFLDKSARYLEIVSGVESENAVDWLHKRAYFQKWKADELHLYLKRQIMLTSRALDLLGNHQMAQQFGIIYDSVSDYDTLLLHSHKETLIDYNAFQEETSAHIGFILKQSDAFSLHIRKLLVLYETLYNDVLLLGESENSLGMKLTYSVKDRERFLETYDKMPCMIYTYLHEISSPSYIQLAFDYTLFNKGALLNTEKNIYQTIPDGTFYLDMLRGINNSKEMMSLTTSVWKRDSIQKMIDADERFLMSAIDKEYVTEQNNISLLELTKGMSKHQIVVEFVSANRMNAYIKTDTIDYYALIIDRRKRTHCIYLFSQYNKNVINITDPPSFLDDKLLSFSIWKKIIQFAHNHDTIYFSPSGILHQIPIESLPFDSVSTMSDHFNMVRLSSTREIVLRNNEDHKESAAIYGGIQYDVDTTELLAESRQYEHSPLASRGIENDTTDRGSVKYLWGTKKEAESIERLLAKHNVSAALYTSTAANEESFKALSGKHQNIIHIGTHGFYWADSTAHKQDFFTQRSMSMGDDLPIQYTIDPLDRCGLLFAGANMALSGHSRDLPEGVQDGILTAKEISLMDLRDCDLVALSACETAKGDITSEGVFGLQRAFKMAGVQTIIMSLWKVDDNATQMLMTEFYTNWIEKKQSKREAFKNAQNAVRFAVDKYGDRMYADPVYWAGFIMLD